MTDPQWNSILDVLDGRTPDKPIAGFIIDSPWLPGWHGDTILDYYSSEQCWINANLQAVNQFPEIIFLPGFWSEFGMCTEPSAFGAPMVWFENDLPHASKLDLSIEKIASIKKPDVRQDGLLPFVIKRLSHQRNAIEAAGHKIRFAVSRGPLNIATFLMGTTEFMMATAMHREQITALLEMITDFIIDWIKWQKQHFEDIEGLLLLDDLMGFLSEDDFRELAVPYFKSIYDAVDFPVRFLHNDAFGLTTAKYLNEIGVNLFNFGFEHSLQEMKDLTANKVTLLGNIPPRDVLASGSPADVKAAVHAMQSSVKDHSRIIWSCGGGMPPGVPTANINAFMEAINTSG